MTDAPDLSHDKSEEAIEVCYFPLSSLLFPLSPPPALSLSGMQVAWPARDTYAHASNYCSQPWLLAVIMPH